MTEKEILRLLKQNGWEFTEGTRYHLPHTPKNLELKFLSRDIKRRFQ